MTIRAAPREGTAWACESQQTRVVPQAIFGSRFALRRTQHYDSHYNAIGRLYIDHSLCCTGVPCSAAPDAPHRSMDRVTDAVLFALSSRRLKAAGLDLPKSTSR
ncbi:hypothetical protein OPV22_024221 [Ensete ventricosum]|uniref:Uncharacterized protein n=1 Tax=Ensete ventricosum TaxID=4639 RepID=A0AAV8QU30_ENSVE|nr:hypothetical protein OPV22_024221 [Ensete ventricosum]